MNVEDLIINHEHTKKYTWHEWMHGYVSGPVEIPGVGAVSVEKTDFGWDSDPYVILRVETGDDVKFYKKTVYNSSFGMDDYGPFDEVHPVTRTIKEFK